MHKKTLLATLIFGLLAGQAAREEVERGIGERGRNVGEDERLGAGVAVDDDAAGAQHGEHVGDAGTHEVLQRSEPGDVVAHAARDLEHRGGAEHTALPAQRAGDPGHVDGARLRGEIGEAVRHVPEQVAESRQVAVAQAHPHRDRTEIGRISTMIASVETLTTPLLPDDYLDLVDPLRSPRYLRARVVDVHVPGGVVTVTVEADGAVLRGPSRLVASGTARL